MSIKFVAVTLNLHRYQNLMLNKENTVEYIELCGYYMPGNGTILAKCLIAWLQRMTTMYVVWKHFSGCHKENLHYTLSWGLGSFLWDTPPLYLLVCSQHPSKPVSQLRSLWLKKGGPGSLRSLLKLHQASAGERAIQELCKVIPHPGVGVLPAPVRFGSLGKKTHPVFSCQLTIGLIQNSAVFYLVGAKLRTEYMLFLPGHSVSS